MEVAGEQGSAGEARPVNPIASRQLQRIAGGKDPGVVELVPAQRVGTGRGDGVGVGPLRSRSRG